MTAKITGTLSDEDLLKKMFKTDRGGRQLQLRLFADRSGRLQQGPPALAGGVRKPYKTNHPHIHLTDG
jgi:hypothetical protein